MERGVYGVEGAGQELSLQNGSPLFCKPAEGCGGYELVSAVEDRHPGIFRYSSKERVFIFVGWVLDLTSQMFRNPSGLCHGENVGRGDVVLLFSDLVEGQQGMADGYAAGMTISDPGVNVDGRSPIVFQPCQR